MQKSNSMVHMLSGKAISRAVHRHMLVDAPLNTLLIVDAYRVPLPPKDQHDESSYPGICYTWGLTRQYDT